MPATSPLNPKYMVLKTEDAARAAWDEFGGGTSSYEALALDPNTYFVIRSHDLFAMNLLENYAGQIANLLEAADRLDLAIPPDVRQRLVETVQSIADLAEDWRHTTKKIPD